MGLEVNLDFTSFFFTFSSIWVFELVYFRICFLLYWSLQYSIVFNEALLRSYSSYRWLILIYVLCADGAGYL